MSMADRKKPAVKFDRGFLIVLSGTVVLIDSRVQKIVR